MAEYATEQMARYEKLRKDVSENTLPLAFGCLLLLAGAGLAIAALAMSSAPPFSDYVNHDRMLTRVLTMVAGLGCFVAGAVFMTGAFIQGAIGRAEAERTHPGV